MLREVYQETVGCEAGSRCLRNRKRIDLVNIRHVQNNNENDLKEIVFLKFGKSNSQGFFSYILRVAHWDKKGLVLGSLHNTNCGDRGG
ncbi:hypothetical protein ABKN59_007365 [Abortiporus biennis]